MPISSEMRRLESRWRGKQGWPLWLDWIELKGVRGWTGQRITFQFPIVALIGENGVGKSTVLQGAAAMYRTPVGTKKTRFASDFFPDTPWERLREVTVRGAGRTGDNPFESSIRKPGERWRGNPQRQERPVEYIDLSRIQPVPARIGYSRLAKPTIKEKRATPFDETKRSRYSQIMARPYQGVRMAFTEADDLRCVPVLVSDGGEYSGFHQGAGETTIAELLQADLPRNGIILIDEIESSLHPRTQRRLVRDLAAMCLERHLQVILTTHSPYVLDELPLEARACIIVTGGVREVVYGVSPEFAMTRMDDVQHPECDVYVEDERAKTLVLEILSAHAPELVQRIRVTAFGAAGVGKSLGMMVNQGRFPRPTCVILDGDQEVAPGTYVLPGGDPPERVVFSALQEANWLDVSQRVGRPFADVADACARVMTGADHHLWVKDAASALVLGGDTLWTMMCSEWATHLLTSEKAAPIARAVRDALDGLPWTPPALPPDALPPPAPPEPVRPAEPAPPQRVRSRKRKREELPPEDELPLFNAV